MKAVLGTIIFLIGACSMAKADAPKNNLPMGWKETSPALHFQKNDLYGHIDGGAELFLEFGFEELIVQRFAKDKCEISVEVYRMENEEAALGIYLMKCGREKPLPGIASRNSGNKYQITILKGNCFIQVNNLSGDTTLSPVMLGLAQNALASIPEGKPVTIFENLPKENLAPGTELLIRGPYALQPIFTFGEGDILQLGGKIFGVVGDYKASDSTTYTRIIVPYPQADLAAAAYANLLTNHDPYMEILDKGKTGFVFRDYQKKFGTVELKNKILDICINLSKRPAKKP